MKKLIVVMAAAVMALCLTGCGCKHEWTDATCTEPKNCTECQEIEGEALGHDWVEADCENPKTCLRCAKTEGEPLGHVEGDWSVVKEATADTLGEKQLLCAACDSKLDSKPLYFYDITDKEARMYTSVLDTYHSLEASHLNPESFKLLGAVAKPDGSRTTIHLAYVGGDGNQYDDYFWKNTSGSTVSNRFGIDNYEGRAMGGDRQILDLEEIWYFDTCGAYTADDDCEVDVRY